MEGVPSKGDAHGRQGLSIPSRSEPRGLMSVALFSVKARIHGVAHDGAATPDDIKGDMSRP